MDLPNLAKNIRLGRKCPTGANTLAYYKYGNNYGRKKFYSTAPRCYYNDYDNKY